MRRYIVAAALLAVPFMAHAEYTFDIVNNSSSKIVGLKVSEDGKTWGDFDVGAGIGPGQSATATWDQSTDESGCEWQVKAEYADGSESGAATFDFCEEDLELEFND